MLKPFFGHHLQVVDTLFYLINFFNVYLFLKETECEHGRGREGDTESESGSRLRAVSTESNAGLKPMNCEIMT